MDAAKNLDGKLETKNNGKVNLMSNSDITNKNKHKNQNSLFFDIPYHPHVVARRKIQQLYSDHCEGGRDGFKNLKMI